MTEHLGITSLESPHQEILLNQSAAAEEDGSSNSSALMKREYLSFHLLSKKMIVTFITYNASIIKPMCMTVCISLWWCFCSNSSAGTGVHGPYVGAFPVVGVGHWFGVGGRVHIGLSTNDHCICCLYLVLFKVSSMSHDINWSGPVYAVYTSMYSDSHKLCK